VLERRLENALDVLVGGARDLPTRQQTLRATLDWSFDLLDGRVQVLFAQLAVFSGGFRLDDLEAVAGDDAGDMLAALVEASLVRRRGERYVMLATIREYAVARLAERVDAAEMRRRHLTHYRDLAEAAWDGILRGGPAEDEGMSVLERESGNLRAAFETAVAARDGEEIVRLAEAQRWFWLVRGRFVEARAAFDAAVDADVPAVLHATALNGAATFARHQGDIARAREQWTEAMRIFRVHGDDVEAARCAAELGGVAVAEGDLGTAEALYLEAADVFSAAGNHVREGVVLSNLSAVAAQRGDLEQAVRYGERAIALQREIGERAGLALALANLAPSAIRLGDDERARTLLRESLELSGEIGYSLLFAHTLAVAGELAAAGGDAELAVRLLGATESAFGAIGGEVPEGERQAFARVLARLGAGEEDVARWWEEGRAWSLELALARVAELVA
jgi:predicted ATPase